MRKATYTVKPSDIISGNIAALMQIRHTPRADICALCGFTERTFLNRQNDPTLWTADDIDKGKSDISVFLKGYDGGELKTAEFPPARTT